MTDGKAASEMDSGFLTVLTNLETSERGKVQEVSPGPVEPYSLDKELQKMLLDERMRCENHKNHYQTLKAEYTRLQSEYKQSQSELKRMLSEKQADQEKLQLLLANMRGEILEKNRELEELRLQVMSPQHLELLKIQLQQEMNIPLMEHCKKLEEEAEQYRFVYNKLRQDFMILKSEFDHQREKHERILEEQQIRHRADLALLETERKRLQREKCVIDVKRVDTLLREKAQMHQRLRSFETEVAELRAQRDNTGAQAEKDKRIHLKQLAESQADFKTLEAEKQSVCMQLERVEKKLRLSQEENVVLTGKLYKAERKIKTLNSQIEDIKHASKLEVTNVKMEFVKNKEELERERDKLQSQIESLQTDLEVLTSANERNKKLLSEKEQEMVLKIRGVREEEMQKIAVLQEEKLELENRLIDQEQLRALQEKEANFKTEELENRLRAACLGEESARKELQRQKAENRELRKQNAELNLQISTLSQSEHELMEINERLKESLEKAESLEEQRRVQWLEEKHKLQEREAELQEKYSQAKQRLQKAALVQKRRKILTDGKEKELQDKLQHLKAKIKELESENILAKQKSEEDAQLIKRLTKLQNRHKVFHQLLLETNIPSVPQPHSVLFTGPERKEEQHLQQLSGLKDRLKHLEHNQEQQLQELTLPLDRENDRPLANQDSLTNL